MKFKVILKEIEIYVLEVEAESEGEAINIGWELLDSEDKNMYHHDSDGESEVEEL